MAALKQEVLCSDGLLLPGAKQTGLGGHGFGAFVKSVPVAIGAGCDALGDNGIAPFADLVLMGGGDDFSSLLCAVVERLHGF